MKKEKVYIAIDLKSFYASVECVERRLDPLDANLVVADESRGDGTICLAVSAALKSFGVPGRPRLFEAKECVRRANLARGSGAATSYSARQLRGDPRLSIGFIAAKPRMALYIEYSTRIYGIYLEFVDAADIHVYSIDEVFIDATPYLRAYGMDARRMAEAMIRRVVERTGITATAGIGSNLYLAKVAMDIKAKHMAPDSHGVRIASLDEMSFRRELWGHRPLTDFWRIGAGTAFRLESLGIHTMGDLARYSLTGQPWLYRIFGVNAELLIDHAWGSEPVEIADIKSYRPSGHSLQSGQVLPRPYSTQSARTVLVEMCDALCLDLVAKGLATSHIGVYIGYERKGDEARMHRHSGAHAHMHLDEVTASCELITAGVTAMFDRIADRRQMIRRLGVSAQQVVLQDGPAYSPDDSLQLFLFEDSETQIAGWHSRRERRLREYRCQRAVVDIRQRYGKNSILRGVNFCTEALQRERNCMIGGHNA